MTDRTDPERSPGAWLNRPGPGVQRACARCGESFVLPTPAARYCSALCRAKANEGRRHRRKPSEPPKGEG